MTDTGDDLFQLVREVRALCPPKRVYRENPCYLAGAALHSMVNGCNVVIPPWVYSRFPPYMLVFDDVITRVVGRDAIHCRVNFRPETIRAVRAFLLYHGWTPPRTLSPTPRGRGKSAKAVTHG